MATQVILLEKVDHLGAMGEVVNVKPGYARNYLLPQNKALRATKQNIAYFDAQKSAIEKVNNEKKSVAEQSAKKSTASKSRSSVRHPKAVNCSVRYRPAISPTPLPKNRVKPLRAIRL